MSKELFDSLDMAELLGESERLSSEGGADFLNNFVRMPEGNGFVTVRLMPPGKGKKFYCATRTHKVNSRNIHCPRVLVSGRWVDEDAKKPCVICKYYNELWKESERKEGKEKADLENAARQIKPIERYYYNCIVRSQVNPKTQAVEKNVGPKILSIGKQLHQRIIRAIVGDPQKEEGPLGDVTHPTTGRDFKIIKSVKPGKDAFPEYHESKFLDQGPLGSPDDVEKWMANLHDLAALRSIKTREEMAIELKKHLGIIKDEQSDFDITEFQKRPEASVEQQVQQAQATRPVPMQTEVPASNKGATVLADAEFLAELQNLKEE
jgi:gp32 DNA binding protein like